MIQYSTIFMWHIKVLLGKMAVTNNVKCVKKKYYTILAYYYKTSFSRKFQFCLANTVTGMD